MNLRVFLPKICNLTPAPLQLHTKEYRTNPKYCLLNLNPTKSKLGKIRKQLLQISKTLRSLRSELNINQSQNTIEVTDRFKNIQQKSSYTFTVFNIQEFYASVMEKLMKDALIFAQRYVAKLNKTNLI